MRRLDLTWVGPEIGSYEKIVAAAKKAKIELPMFVKSALRESTKKNK
jgi:hypothetical protein